MDLGDKREPGLLKGEIVFDPDLELEWELGPDTEIVFEPEPADE